MESSLIGKAPDFDSGECRFESYLSINRNLSVIEMPRSVNIRSILCSASRPDCKSQVVKD